MTSSTYLSVYIAKLSHPIKEIRERALKLLQAKLKFGWEMEDELSCSRDLLQSLLSWLCAPQPALQQEVLEVFLTVLKTKAGSYIAREIGIEHILSNLFKIKSSIHNSETLDLFNDLVDTLQFLNTVESSDHVSIPRLNIPSITSSESEGGYHSDNYNIGTCQSSRETLTSLVQDESECQLDKSTDGIRILLLPWVKLSSSDSKTMLLIEDALKLLKSVRRCCRFICNVFMRDFPVEIFLNRPTIIKNLLTIYEGVHGNQSYEALQVLLCITKKLSQRIIELSCIDLIHNSSKFSDEHRNINENLNIELEQIISNGEMIAQDHEDSLVALKQLPAPLFALDTMNIVVSILIKNIMSVDEETRNVINANEINTCLDLLESLIQLLLSCVSEQFWKNEHSTKTHRDIAHKSCMVMRLLGDLLTKYRKSFTMNSNDYHTRSVWIRLVVFVETLLTWARESALPPTTMVAALYVAQLDPALHMLYPHISDKVTSALTITKTSMDKEYKSKYRELMKLTNSMDDAVRFMKNKNNCRNAKAVLSCIKKSLPVIELHMSESYINDVADILMNKIKDFNLDNTEWNAARSIALSLMAHTVEWIRAKFYTTMADMVKYVLVGDETNQTENEKCLVLLFDVGILTEICCHGLSSKTKQVEISAIEIMLYLLRGRLILSESCWWRLLASLLPVFPLLHAYAAHDTQLGQAICKSMDMEIASCMGVSVGEVVSGLVRLLFVRCVAVQLDAAHSLCLLLDDDRYLPPKEALRADVLMNALKRTKPDDFNVDPKSSPSKNPQITGLLQILDVLKQDIILDEHGTEYVTRDNVRPILEPALRRSTLQQLAVLMRQQDLHEAFLQNDGLKVVVAILRMSLMVDDYLAFPECALSCVSILNSVCFVSRHSLANINDLFTLLIRVILVFPANDSAVLMSAQVLALTAWSGFALQELDADRKRVPSLPACVTQRTLMPFRVNSYWNTSTNTEHSSIEWLSTDEEYRSSLRVRWWCAYEGATRVCHGAPLPPAPLALIPNDRDRAILRATCPINAMTTALLALENATSHAQVNEALVLLESYVHLIPWSSASSEEFVALPWQHMRRFLRAPPASCRDTKLLTSLMHFIIVYMDKLPVGNCDWIKSSLIGSDATVISLLSKDQLLLQQTAQESIEVTQLHIHIVKVLLRCVKRLEYEDYECNKLESLLKILLSCLERIDLKNFHALGYLNELMRCIRYVLNSRYCKLSEETLLHTLKVVSNTLTGCASGGGRKGQACRLDAVLSLLVLLRQVQEEGIPVQRWSEIWNGDVMASIFACSRSACALLRSASIRTVAALAYYPQLLPHLLQATQEESLTEFAVQIFTETQEANVVRGAAADLLSAITARASPHCDILENEVLTKLNDNSVMQHCIDIMVGFSKEKEYESNLEPNVPLSLLERRPELEVRSRKLGDVNVSPRLTASRQPPATPALIPSVADMIHNASAFTHFPVQNWNEHGIFKLLFRCTYWSNGSPLDVVRVRGAACRALVAVTSHKCVRVTLASTKDCLHHFVQTIMPLQEEEMYRECLEARVHALSLLGSLLANRSASESVWTDLKDRQMTNFFCCLLQALESDEMELQRSAMYCLTLLAQSAHNQHQEKSKYDSCIQYYDSIISPFSTINERAAGDATKEDCQPEYMAEELCKVLMKIYRSIQLETKKYQCGQDDIWARVCSCLSSVLSVSHRSRLYSVHCEFPKMLLSSLQGVRDHLSVVGKPVETIKNANHNPTLRTLYCLLVNIDSSLVECPPAKESYAEESIATSLNKLWPWCMMTDQLRHAVVNLLFNFTNECPKAWSAMSMCVGNRNLVGEICALSIREAALQSRTRTDTLLLQCLDTLRHCASHHQCRALTLKSDVLSSVYKTIVRDRGRSTATGISWSRLCSTVARYADGASSLLTLRPLLSSLPAMLRAHLMPALAHAAHHHRVTFLQSPDLLELLSGTLLAGDTAEMISAARAVWTLAANNHKAKLLLRSAGVASAVHSALQRVQRSHSDPTSQRALQLLTYTNTVLQAS